MSDNILESSRFAQLPREVRDMIYRELLTITAHRYVYPENQCWPIRNLPPNLSRVFRPRHPFQRRWDWALVQYEIPIAVFRVNRMLRQEALAIEAKANHGDAMYVQYIVLSRWVQ